MSFTSLRSVEAGRAAARRMANVDGMGISDASELVATRMQVPFVVSGVAAPPTFGSGRDHRELIPAENPPVW
jgi:hypothetical protein